MINTGNPDIAKIQAMVDKAIVPPGEGDGAGKSAKGGKKGFSKGGAATTGASKGNISDGYAANDSKNLSNAC